MMRLLLNVSPAKLMPTLWRTMWSKYDYVCTDCDALMEITTLVNIREWRGWCSCGSANLINIGVSDGNAPIITDVSKVTPVTLVKIDSNPYN